MAQNVRTRERGQDGDGGHDGGEDDSEHKPGDQEVEEQCNVFEKGWLERWRRNGWHTSGKQAVLNRDLWEELWELSRIHSIRWHWVKGHAGDERNNRCDALVQRAKEEFFSGMSPADSA